MAKALRVLADYDYLHTRYYGAKEETDYHVSEPENADPDESEIPSDVDGEVDVAAHPVRDVDESTAGGAGEVVP